MNDSQRRKSYGIPHREKLFGALCCLLLCVGASAQTNNLPEMKMHYERAQEALRANDPDSAAKEFNEILRLDPKNAEARASLGLIAFNKADYARAAREFEASLSLKPALWNAEAFLGLSQVRLGNAQEAQSHLERAFPHLQDNPLRVQAGTELIVLYKRQGDILKVVNTLETLQRAAPGNQDVLYTAYRTYSDLAARALADLAQAGPDSARLHQILAQTSMSRDDFPGAMEEYRKALKDDPSLPEIHFELGQAILANSVDEPSRAQAEKEFEAALATNPNDADAEYELGEIALLRSDREAARQHYSRALELRPHFVNAQLGLGKVLAAEDQPQAALNYLLDAERSDPRNETVHYQLATLYRKLGQTGDADREWGAFQELRKSKEAIRSLYQEILQRPSNSK
jgi:tetratricopeptide (TPR) repeat protein